MVGPLSEVRHAGRIEAARYAAALVVILASWPDPSRNGGPLGARPTARHRVVRTIPVGHEALDLAISPSGRRLYVANDHDSSISVVSTRRAKVITTYTGFAWANAVAVSPDGTRLYVSDQGPSGDGGVRFRPVGGRCADRCRHREARRVLAPRPTEPGWDPAVRGGIRPVARLRHSELGGRRRPPRWLGERDSEPRRQPALRPLRLVRLGGPEGPGHGHAGRGRHLRRCPNAPVASSWIRRVLAPTCRNPMGGTSWTWRPALSSTRS